MQHRGEQYEHQVRLLQHEHSVLWKTLADTNAVLTRLKAAFDPLTVLPEPSSEVSLDASVLQAPNLELRIPFKLQKTYSASGTLSLKYVCLVLRVLQIDLWFPHASA